MEPLTPPRTRQGWKILAVNLSKGPYNGSFKESKVPISPSEKVQVPVTIADLPVDSESFWGWDTTTACEQVRGITTSLKINTLIFVCYKAMFSFQGLIWLMNETVNNVTIHTSAANSNR